MALSNGVSIRHWAVAVMLLLTAVVYYYKHEERATRSETIDHVEPRFPPQEDDRFRLQEGVKIARVDADPIEPPPFRPEEEVIGFWHVGSSAHKADDRDKLVLTQLKEITDFLKIDNWRIQMVPEIELSVSTQKTVENTGRISIVKGRLEKERTWERNATYGSFYEFLTLAELHSFCQDEMNVEKTVFYIHTKGKRSQRQSMTKDIFSKCPERLANDPEKLVCGSHFTHGLWCHYSGNFWFARCKWIRQLNYPYDLEIVKEGWAQGRHGGWPHDSRPHGRFFAEYWLMNDKGPRVPHSGLPFQHKGKKQKCKLEKSQIC